MAKKAAVSPSKKNQLTGNDNKTIKPGTNVHLLRLYDGHFEPRYHGKPFHNVYDLLNKKDTNKHLKVKNSQLVCVWYNPRKDEFIAISDVDHGNDTGDFCLFTAHVSSSHRLQSLKVLGTSEDFTDLADKYHSQKNLIVVYQDR